MYFSSEWMDTVFIRSGSLYERDLDVFMRTHLSWNKKHQRSSIESGSVTQNVATIAARIFFLRVSRLDYNESVDWIGYLFIDVMRSMDLR